MPRIAQPGPLAPGLDWIGHPGVLVYLLRGQRTALVDSGMTVMGPLLAAGLRSALGDLRALDWQLLTHGHYDHLGSTTMLLRRHPGLRVAAHPALGRMLARPSAIALIRSLNETLMGGSAPEGDPDLVPCEPFAIDRPLADGDEIDLGDGLEVRVIATPGHTRDSLTFHLPRARAIIPGEAAGVPDLAGQIMPEFLQSYSDYTTSLETLAALDLEMICLPHNYVLTGADARGYCAASLAATTAFRARILAALDTARGEAALATATLLDELYSPAHGQPRDAFLLNLQAMVRAVERDAA